MLQFCTDTFRSSNSREGVIGMAISHANDLPDHSLVKEFIIAQRQSADANKRHAAVLGALRRLIAHDLTDAYRKYRKEEPLSPHAELSIYDIESEKERIVVRVRIFVRNERHKVDTSEEKQSRTQYDKFAAEAQKRLRAIDHRIDLKILDTQT